MTKRVRKAWAPVVRQAIYDFHVRSFGEEMARVNFLPLEDRRRYVAAMADHARVKGVCSEKLAMGVTI